jgi:hypothetical protein
VRAALQHTAAAGGGGGAGGLQALARWAAHECGAQAACDRGGVRVCVAALDATAARRFAVRPAMFQLADADKEQPREAEGGGKVRCGARRGPVGAPASGRGLCCVGTPRVGTPAATLPCCPGVTLCHLRIPAPTAAAAGAALEHLRHAAGGSVLQVARLAGRLALRSSSSSTRRPLAV